MASPLFHVFFTLLCVFVTQIFEEYPKNAAPWAGRPSLGGFRGLSRTNDSTISCNPYAAIGLNRRQSGDFTIYSR
jgi:hypothetical protein